MREKRFKVKKKYPKQLSQCGMCEIVQFRAFAIGRRQAVPSLYKTAKRQYPHGKGRANTNQSSAVTNHRTENTRVKQVRGGKKCKK